MENKSKNINIMKMFREFNISFGNHIEMQFIKFKVIIIKNTKRNIMLTIRPEDEAIYLKFNF